MGITVSEDQMFDHMVSMLAAEFPVVDTGRIADEVRRVRDGYAAAPVRTYVPVLVERAARSSLRSLAH